MHESVIDVRGLNGTTIAPADMPTHRVVTSSADDSATVQYTLSWNPALSRGLAFSPSVDAAHFHFFGSQWMARHRDDGHPCRFRIAFDELPPDWGAFSSFGIGAGPHEFVGSYDDCVATFIAGGAYRARQFDVQGQTVLTAVYGQFDMSDDDIFDAVRKIVRAERGTMPVLDQPFYTVCVTERERIRAGTSFLNAFVCLVRPTVSPEDFLLLLAHEMFHAWVPLMGEIAGPDADESGMRYEWVHEGLTEYLARRILLDQGLVDQAWFVSKFNGDLEDLAFNHAATINYDELRRREDDGEFTNAEERLAYYRGPLIGLAWEEQIRLASSGKKTLLEAISAMVEHAAASDGIMTEAAFNELMAEYGVDVQSTLQRYILDGKAIDPSGDVFLPEYTLKRIAAPGFEPGFDLRRSSMADKVIGVQPGSPAHIAGLRDDMMIVELRNAWRHSSSWTADEPLTVVVDEDGAPREISFRPHATTIEYWQYVPVEDHESP